MNKLTRQEKSVIDDQNELLAELISDRFKKVPFSISRDNQNRVIAVFGQIDQPLIEAEMLGLYKHKKPMLKQVAVLSYTAEDEKTLHINYINLDKAFEGAGIDHILLQSFQNFASEAGIRTISTNLMPSQTMLDGFSSPPDQFSSVQIDPTLITFLSNNYHRVLPYNHSYLSHSPLLENKYYLQNTKIKPVDVAHQIQPQTKQSKIRRAFKPYKVQLDVAEKFYNDSNSVFSPLNIGPNEVGTKLITSLMGSAAKEESTL